MLTALFKRQGADDSGSMGPPEDQSQRQRADSLTAGLAPPPIPPRPSRSAPLRPPSVSSAQSAAGVVGTPVVHTDQTPATIPGGANAASSSSSSNPLCPPTSAPTMCGWISKVEVRPLLGVITRRRYWCALADGSPYLYWFKDRADVQCVGRLAVRGAAFTFDARDKGRFTVLANNEEHVFEAGDAGLRDEWLRALQDTRKRSWNSHVEIDKEIKSLTATSSNAHDETTTSFEDTEGQEKEQDRTIVEKREDPPTSPSVVDLLSELGPTTSSEEKEDEEGREGEGLEEGGEGAVHVIGDARRPTSPSIPIPRSPTSTFYLAADGSLNEHSLEMPKEPEPLLSGLEAPTRRALERVRLSLREWRITERECDECKKLADSLSEAEAQIVDLLEERDLQEERSRVHKKALTTLTRQIDTMKKTANLSKEDEEETMLLLGKDKELTDAQWKVVELQRRLQESEEEKRTLESTVGSLQADIEAFRESVRTKEELIMRLAEQSDLEAVGGERRGSIYGDVDVPEGIPLEDGSCAAVEEETRRLYEEQGVRDVHEMRDLVDGYKHQNVALNHEIVELHRMLQAYEERERRLARNLYESQACYYQMKSRYIMVLNHFKSPEKPGKIMEPGVLRQLVDEANRTPKSSRREGNEDATKSPPKQTDNLGFYMESGAKGGDMFETAAECQKKCDELLEAGNLEQSEEYMKWLQAWDAFLVNSVNCKNTLGSSPELKALVRTGVPLAHRARVWARLVSFHVRDRQSEMGFGYFECMLKKARNKKEEGVFDAAIKQIDLDLARTLPTNKFFEDPSSEKVEQLRRVLYAFRYHNAEVGYCQGLNRLAAIGLLYLTEEEAFWFMSACVEVLQPPGYYTATLIGAVADQRVLRDLVQERLPRLANHLKSLEVDLSLFTLSWFLTCFVDVLPHTIYLNMFDVFLYEGNKSLFRFALALLKLAESQVVQCKTIGTVHACLSKAAEFVPNYKRLAQVAFNDLNPFPQKAIEQKRQMYLAQLKEQGYR